VLAFEKWQGLGNDFIVVDAKDLPASADVETIQRLCDRRRGVGADGVLVVDRSGSAPRMVVRNADGSRPEMCGNGLRCVLGYLLLREPKLVERVGRELAIAVETDAGLLACEARTAGGIVEAQVEMGRARFDGPLEVPFDGERYAFERVNMGNPHAIQFVPRSDALIERLGPIVERSVAGGTNVEFVGAGSPGEPSSGASGGFTIRVWERGVGFTDACGTGACAVIALACREGRAPFDAWVTATLPGGALSLRVAQETFAVSMRGPAARSFRGSTDLV
jgi:diaminopimelate epimerase